MKKNLFSRVTFYVLLMSFSAHSQGFNHPGALHTQDDFERIKAQLAANDSMVTAAYDNLKNNEWAQSNVGTWPVETINRGITGDENYINAARGAHAAYMNALRWKISGDVSHAECAVRTLNAWASVTKGLGGNSNVSLASGLYGYEFANAAELMRDYAGWNTSDFKKFQEWMMYIWYPRCLDFLDRRHDTWSQDRPGHYWSNWGLCNSLALVSVGVLCDDVFVYNQGLSYYKYDYVGTFRKDKTGDDHLVNDGLTEFIGNLVPTLFADERGPLGYLGQMQESGRDQGHTLMALGLAVDICQIGWNQGDDLFAYMDNRLAAGIEYVAAYNTGVEQEDLPWKNYWYHDVRTNLNNSWIQAANNGGGRGQYRPFWDRIVGHYEGIKGITMTNSTTMRNRIGADFGGGGSTSGGYDHLGFSTLTCTRPSITPEDAPTALKATLLYKGDSLQRGELTGVERGSAIRFIPSVPDEEENTDNWLWDTGSTSKDLVIVADSSRLYRVTYTNSRGVKSSQLFSVAVLGDCWPDRTTFSIRYESQLYPDTIITVKQFSRVQLEVGTSSWRSTYKWHTGETGAILIPEVANADTLYSVECINQGGAKTTINFHVNVETLGYSHIAGDGEMSYSRHVAVLEGEAVTLIPMVKEGMEGGTWLWSDGSENSTLVVEAPQDSTELSVTYLLNEKEYVLTYRISVLTSLNDWAYWSMDEDAGSVAYDSWRGNTAQLNSTEWLRYGALNSGVKLNGTASSFVSLPVNIVSSLDDFTIAVWIKPATLDAWSRIFDFGSGTTNYMFLTGIASDGYLRFGIKAGGGMEQTISTSYTLSADTWTHIAVTKSGNVGLIYVNGVAVGRSTTLSIPPSDLGYTDQNYIGKSQYPSDPLFQGNMDELYVYSKALSQGDLLELRDRVIPGVPDHLSATVDTSSNVVLHWDAVPGATAYTIKRSSHSQGPYSAIRTTNRNSYTNKGLTDGTYYYVVSALNLSFEGVISNEMSVSIGSAAINEINVGILEVFPNPVKDRCEIILPALFISETIHIYDINGGSKICPTNRDDNRCFIDMSALSMGIYFFEVLGSNGKLVTKIVKQ